MNTFLHLYTGKKNQNRTFMYLGITILVCFLLFTLPLYSATKSKEKSKIVPILLKVAELNPEIKASTLDAEASMSDMNASKGQKGMQITGIGATGAAQVFAPNGGTFPQASAFLELRQNIWNRSLTTQVEQRTAEYNERKTAIAFTQTNILRRFCMLYIDWINITQNIAIYKRQADTLERILKLSETKYRRGDDTKLSVHQARIRYLNSKEQVRILETRQAATKERLSIEVQKSIVFDTAQIEDFEQVITTILGKTNSERPYFGDEAREARLLLAESSVENTKQSNSSRLDLVVRGGATNYSSTNTFNYSGKSIVPEVDLGLELTIPLYDGSTHSHALRAAMQRRNAIEERNHAELAQTKAQIIDAKSNQLISQNSQITYNDVMKLISSREKGLERLFRSGANTLFELLNSTEDLLIIERQRASDYQSKLQADVELAVTTNKLNVENLEKLSKGDANERK